MQERDTRIGLGVVVKGLHKSYRQGMLCVQALRGVDLTVPAGQFLCIMGPCASGKSTLLRLVAGLEVPSIGSVALGDFPVQAGEAAHQFRRVNTCVIGELFEPVLSLTVEENVALPLLLDFHQYKDTKERVESALLQVNLLELRERTASMLSGGELQRLGLARAIALRPAIVLADSPTDNLDGRTAEEVLAILRCGPDNHGATLILATHDIRSASYADRIVVMRAGIIADDVPAHSMHSKPV